MPSLSPTTPTLPSYNPVRRLSIPYHIKTQGLFRRSSCDTAISHDEDGEDHLLSNGSRERKSGFRKLCGYVFLALLSLLVGLIAGHFIRVEDKLNGYMKPYDRSSGNLQEVVWNKNSTFADAPSELTEAAWATLIANGRGFVRHPKLTSNDLKSVSAFHEIHCLHGIRTAYFRADYLVRKHEASYPVSHDRASAFVPNDYLENVLAQPEHAHGHNLEHIQHCFDYLRQALMCAADSNLEDVAIEEGSVSTLGWGSKRVCRNYEELKRWSETWRAADVAGIA